MKNKTDSKFPGSDLEGSAMYWLKQAHDKGYTWAEKAMANLDYLPPRGGRYSSMIEMVQSGFRWAEAPEGGEYWIDVCEELKHLERQTPSCVSSSAAISPDNI